ncbi:MAG: type VII secretion protein EssC [Oliverpabstia sp.]
MRLVLAIYTNNNYKEIHLPALDNSNYSLMLYKKEFDLKNDIRLQLEIVDEIWKFRRSIDYQIFYQGKSFEGEPISKGNVLQVQTRNGDKFVIFVWQDNKDIKAYKKYYVTDDYVVIGRSEDSDIQYQNTGVISHHHAVISYRNGSIYLKDLSKNGTYLDHVRIEQEKSVHFGDLINLYGLSIICLGRYLAINSLDGEFFINSEKMREVTELELDERTHVGDMEGEAETLVHISLRNLPKLYEGEEKIENVPQKKEEDKKPAWMTVMPSLTMVLPMMLGYSIMNAGAMSMGIIISGGAAIVGVTWAIINLRYSRKKSRDEELLRLRKYEEYLIESADNIREKFDFNRESLLKLYPDAEVCSRFNEDSAEIWSRKSGYSDFLFIRLGLGNKPFQVKIKVPSRGFSLMEDELAERPAKIAQNYENMNDVPLGVSLLEHSVVGIVTGNDFQRARNIERIMITQIAANHCYTEAKIAMLYDDQADVENQETYVRWLPHIWNEERTMRYYAVNEKEAGDVIFALAQILRTRSEQMAGNTKQGRRTLPHYILFVENISFLDQQPIVKYLYENGQELGITTVLLTDIYEHLPNACDYVIQYDDEFEGTFAVQEGGDVRREVSFDYLSMEQADRMARRMSSMRVNQIENSSDIPSSLTFFEMMGIQHIEELNVIEKWKKNRTYENMQALVGQKVGGQNCYLDINEKYHGPHGLVAGTTGSGKSETLQTYILSLAINFSPQDVGLFIIDFKGGGMGNLFANLPHTLGVISNLSGNQVRRAMVSITSEINRRQRIFGSFGVNHIDAYTKLVKNREASVPIPHLLIIIDEFAELKREEPEFMKKLISVAQVGRSLGVHLILATQKPSGTVDDNIWSNTKFKLCLRVADKQDSNDMLHRPDAAYLTQAGRCYLQVGNNEIFELFQSGWSGAVYDETNDGNQKSAILLDRQGHETNFGRKLKSEKKRKATIQWMKEVIECIDKVTKQQGIRVNSLDKNELSEVAKTVIQLLNRKKERYPENVSNIRKMENVIQSCPDVITDAEEIAGRIIEYFQVQGKKIPEPQEKTQLDVVVSYLADIAKTSGMENKQMLWMPVLPTQMYLDDLKEYKQSAFRDGKWSEHREFKLSTCIGLVDDPENQMQFPMTIDFAEKGHLLVMGNVTSGKSTFLQTMIYGLISTYSPKEVNIYVVDYSSQMLCPFEEDAHVGGVVIEGEDDKLNKLFGMIMKMLQDRKKQIRGGNFSQYVRVNGYVIPAVILVIDGYANFREKTENRFENSLMELSRAAEGYGIYLAVGSTSIGSSDLQSKIADNFRQKICLEMGDKYSYGPILGITSFDVLPETNVKGRGLANIDGNILEYQTALACKSDNDYDRSEKIKQCCHEMSIAWHGKCAEAIPEIPAKPTWEIFSNLAQYKECVKEKQILPVAYYQENAAIYGIDLCHSYRYLILGRERMGKSVFMRNIACAAKDAGGQIYLIDKSNKNDYKTAQMTGATYASEASEIKDVIKELIMLTNERGVMRKTLTGKGYDDDEIYQMMSKEFCAVYVLIADFADFLRIIYTDIADVGKMNAPIETIFAKGRLLNVHFFAAANVEQIPQMTVRPAYLNFVADKMGTVLGGEMNKQNVFAYQNIKFSEQGKRLKTGQAYAVNAEDNSRVDLIVFPQNKGLVEE